MGPERLEGCPVARGGGGQNRDDHKGCGCGKQCYRARSVVRARAVGVYARMRRTRIAFDANKFPDGPFICRHHRDHKFRVGAPVHCHRAQGDRWNVDELTGGRFTVTIMRGVVGERKPVWGSPTCGCAMQALRPIGPRARGRPVLDLLLRQHRSERGRPRRCVFARAISMVGAA
jgi:hypothetical protein